MSADTYDIGASSEQKALDEIISEEVAYLRNNIRFITKEFVTIKAKKVNVVGARGKSSRNKESDSKEEAKYLDREMAGFQTKGQAYNKETWKSR